MTANILDFKPSRRSTKQRVTCGSDAGEVWISITTEDGYVTKAVMSPESAQVLADWLIISRMDAMQLAAAPAINNLCSLASVSVSDAQLPAPAGAGFFVPNRKD